MTDSSRIVGPRGWAVLVLAGGAALSAPFLRNAGSPSQTAGTTANPSEVDFSKKSWPDVREKALTPAGTIATNLSEQDWAELERLKANSGAGPRKLTGNLPSTSATPLPSWAERAPRIDQLVNNSIRAEPLAPAPVGSAGLDPLRPWIGAGMKPNVQSSESVPQGIGPSNIGPSGDLVFRTPNPDARWSSGTSMPPNSASGESGAIASNQPFRKFEDHVKQWPDEKMLNNQVVPGKLDPGKLAWGQSNLPPSDRSTVSSNSNWPVSQPAGIPIASQTTSPSNASTFTTPLPQVRAAETQAAQLQAQQQSSLATPAALPETPDTVSAPMVSSQSGRQAPRLNGPIIEGPKPSMSTPPRQKHFIQQPTKRA